MTQRMLERHGGMPIQLLNVLRTEKELYVPFYCSFSFTYIGFICLRNYDDESVTDVRQSRCGENCSHWQAEVQRLERELERYRRSGGRSS